MMFQFRDWVDRGVCVRPSGATLICYESLNTALSAFNELRKGEYAGAASVLALLPTIGALLGAPTSEIWRLLTVVPSAGVIAMTLSFGSAILPVRVEDYKNDLKDSKVAVYQDVAKDDVGLEEVVRRIERRMRQDESVPMPKSHLIWGVSGMMLLACGAQAAMIVIEQGGVIPWLCTSRYWMHLWYFLGMETPKVQLAGIDELSVTFSAVMDNWAQYPFSNT